MACRLPVVGRTATESPAWDGCAGTRRQRPESRRPESAMANGFANETLRDGGDNARHRRCPATPAPGQQDAPERRRRGETCVVVLIAQRRTAMAGNVDIGAVRHL